MTKIKTTLLVDADIIAYNAAQSQEVAKESRDGYWTWYCKFSDVLASFNSRVDDLVTLLNADDYRLFVSDDERNFRKEVYPEYKSHRQKKKRPVVLRAFRKYLLEERGAEMLPSLEGDDLCGIYATNGSIEGDTIIISADKDLKTIPGYLFREGQVQWVSKEEADYYHLYQTLIGDQTDGYPGCKGIGPKKAETALKNDPSWNTVVRLFEEAGQTEEDALVQARCARILRAGEYDFEKQEVILWTPNSKENNTE